MSGETSSSRQKLILKENILYYVQPQQPMYLKSPRKKIEFADKTIYKQTLR